MKFGVVPLSEAEGAILAHASPAANPQEKAAQKTHWIAKGTRLDAGHLADLARAGTREVPVARLEPGDVPENAAATRLATALAGGHASLEITEASTGRVNLRAGSAGLAALDADRLNAMNRISAGITVATVTPWKKMAPRGLIATIKIIPFAVPQTDLDRACAVAKGAVGMVHAQLASASLIETRVGRAAPPDKGRRSTLARLQQIGVALTDRCVVPHDVSSIAQALAQAPGALLLILTETATSDIRDTAPEAVRAAGGEVVHYGMPVDPGNLLFLGWLGGKPVIGLPGCARSPALNGADWVLERLACGVPIGPDEIMAMGVGGLLKEIPTRPQPRRG